MNQPVAFALFPLDRSLQVQAEVPLSVGQSRGPLIDPPYHPCSLEHGDQEVGDRMWVNLRIDLSGWPAAFSRSISGNQIHAPETPSGEERSRLNSSVLPS